MTHLILLLNDQMLIVLEYAQPAVQLAAEINSGSWLAPALLRLPRNPGQPLLRAVDKGGVVIARPLSALNGAADGLAASESLSLSPRQRQVLLCLAEGLTNKQIALRLKLHPRTIALHIAAIKARIGANTRAQSVGKAARLGLVPSDKP